MCNCREHGKPVCTLKESKSKRFFFFLIAKYFSLLTQSNEQRDCFPTRISSAYTLCYLKVFVLCPVHNKLDSHMDLLFNA